jgi:hypothetical protein
MQWNVAPNRKMWKTFHANLLGRIFPEFYGEFVGATLASIAMGEIFRGEIVLKALFLFDRNF